MVKLPWATKEHPSVMETLACEQVPEPKYPGGSLSLFAQGSPWSAAMAEGHWEAEHGLAACVCPWV